MGCQTLAYTLDLMVEAACEMDKKLHFGVGRTLHFNPTWVPLSLQQNLLSICCILCLVSSGGTAVWEIEVVPALLWLPVAPSQTALTSVAVNNSSLLSLPVMGVAGLGLVDLTWGPSYSCSLMVVGA